MVASNVSGWWNSLKELLSQNDLVSNAEKKVVKKMGGKYNKAVNEAASDGIEKTANTRKFKEKVKESRNKTINEHDEMISKFGNKDGDITIQREAARKVGKDATKEEFEAAVNSIERENKVKTGFQAVKDYYADPLNKIKNSKLDDATRDLAKKQFIARAGVTAAAGTATIGIGHDLLANKENDTGLGGIAVNTAAMAGIGTGAAAGAAAMLRKL